MIFKDFFSVPPEWTSSHVTKCPTDTMLPQKTFHKKKKKDIPSSNLSLFPSVHFLAVHMEMNILYPKKENKLEKNPQVPEATADKLKSAEAQIQNTLKGVIELPKKEPGYSFETITDDMKKKNVYQTQRKEIKTAKGFYARLEKIKAKK